MGLAQIIFTPSLTGTHFKQHMSYSVIFLRLDTLKGTSIILTVGILDFSTLSGTNLQIVTPKRYDFQIEVPIPRRYLSENQVSK